eukprot:TRINITY_DN4250_c0_g1_i3.p3 TRINITY_DN4250_c0_g1~~TRINITY_DN4250_c0_g1_i3.p3  ORF type:complete len:122 (-),score=7.52 TRINITY_DN4250_c0_g1_i3:32-397(-)
MYWNYYRRYKSSSYYNSYKYYMKRVNYYARYAGLSRRSIRKPIYNSYQRYKRYYDNNLRNANWWWNNYQRYNNSIFYNYYKYYMNRVNYYARYARMSRRSIRRPIYNNYQIYRRYYYNNLK